LRYITPKEKNKVKDTLTDTNSPKTTNTLSAVRTWSVITYVVKTTKLMRDCVETYNAPLIARKKAENFTALVSRLTKTKDFLFSATSIALGV